jgi:hypothetical protein
MKKVMVVLAALALSITALVFQAAPARGIDTSITVAATSQPLGIKLEWSHPTASGVVGYVVRRGDTAGHEDRWPLNDFPVTGVTFLDENITPGTTYYYVVVPVLRDGTWGTASSEVSSTAVGVDAGATLAHFHMDATEALVRTAGGETKVALTGKALVDHDRVMLNAADVTRLTGATLETNLGATLIKLPGGMEMTMEVGKPSLTFAKASRPDTCAPITKDGVTYLPLRWVVEAMQGSLTFNPLDRSVTILMPAR